MRSKLAVTLTAAVVLAATLTGCGHDNSRDLKNVHNTDPDYVVNILNMDRQPNVALLCFEGVSMLTTTRQYDALTLAPKLDAFCDTQKKRGGDIRDDPACTHVPEDRDTVRPAA